MFILVFLKRKSHFVKKKEGGLAHDDKKKFKPQTWRQMRILRWLY